MKRQDQVVEDLTELLEELKIDQQRIKNKMKRLESTIAEAQIMTQIRMQEGNRVTIDNPKSGEEVYGIVVGHTRTGLLRVKTASGKINVIRAEKNITPK